MTLLGIEGFETSKATGALQTKYDVTTITSVSSTPSPVNPLLSMCNFGSFAGFINTFVFVDSSTIFIGMRWMATTATDGQSLIEIKKGAGTQCRLRQKAGTAANSTKFELVRGGTGGSDGTILATSADIPGTTYCYLELKVKVHETLGAFEFKINEVQSFINSGNVNTANNADATNVCNNLLFRCPTNLPSAIDDIYWLNDAGAAPYNTYLGDIIIEGVTVIADGATNNFPTIFPVSPVTHFDKVDDPVTIAPDGTATYVQSTVDGQKELYAMSDLAVISSNILGLQAEAYVKLTNTGSRNIHHTYRQGTGGSSGTEADGAVVAVVQTGFDPAIQQLWALNPVTGVAWTLADINAMQIGIETG